MFVHHVFFWLKENLSSEDIQKFEEHVTSLMQIEYVKFGDIGRPALTERPVIDRSYSYSLLVVFENEEGHNAYQPHPIHKKFVDACAHMWYKVLIYDAESLLSNK